MVVLDKNNKFHPGNHTNHREIKIYKPDIPTRSPSKSEPISTASSFVMFTHSDIHKDAAQTTVPFLDAQEVVTNPSMPLQGVGLYYKGQSGYGGFIAPKIFTIDLSIYVQKPEDS
jgi:hypothetical protein